MQSRRGESAQAVIQPWGMGLLGQSGGCVMEGDLAEPGIGHRPNRASPHPPACDGTCPRLLDRMLAHAMTRGTGLGLGRILGVEPVVRREPQV